MAFVMGAAVLAAVFLCVRLSLIDLRQHRLPNGLIGLLLVAVGVCGAVRVATEDWPVAWLIFGAVGFGLPFLVINLVRPAALGFGDVKLAFVLGVLIGSFAPSAVPFALGAVVVVQLVLRLVLGPRVVAFGPILIGAALISVGPSVYDYFMGI